MDANTVKVVLAILGVLAGGTGITLLVRIAIRKRVDSTRTKQNQNVVYGDQAGRDIKK